MTRRTGSRSDRLAAGVRQAAEYGVGLLLIGFSLHANGGAPILLGAAAVVVLWAAINDAPLAGVRIVGRGLHRAGVLIEGVVLAGLPVITGHLTDLSVAGPSLFAGIMLFQLAVTRRSWRRQLPIPDHPGAQTPEPSVKQAAPSPTSAAVRSPDASAPSSARVSPARLAGVLSARMGTVVAKQAEVRVPAGARRAGRLAGRLGARRRP